MAFLFSGIGEPRLCSITPLGIGYLSANLKKRGYEAIVFNLNNELFLSINPKYRYLWHAAYVDLWMDREKFYARILPVIKDSIDNAIDEIIYTKPTFTCFSLYWTSVFVSCYMAKKIKEKNNKSFIIFGGPECTSNNAKYFIEKEGADAVVIGEGEETLSEIVQNFKETGKLNPCKGGFFRINNQIVYGGERNLIKNLDTLPLPDFQDYILDCDRFSEKYIPISWMRGCNNRCTFCYEALFWRYPRVRSPEAICEEFEYQSKKYKNNVFSKNDSTLSVSGEHLARVCDLLIKRNLRVRWGGVARIEDYLTYDLLNKMRMAGCEVLQYGIESGSQKIVNAMKKNFSLKKAEEVLVATKKARIRCGIFIIYGYPGETLFDFIKTVYFLFRNRKSIDWFIPSRFESLFDYNVRMEDSRIRHAGNFWRFLLVNIVNISKGYILMLYSALLRKPILGTEAYSYKLYRFLILVQKLFHRQKIDRK